MTNIFLFKLSTLESNAFIPSSDPSLEQMLKTILVFLLLPHTQNVYGKGTHISLRSFNSGRGQRFQGAKSELNGTISMAFFCRKFKLKHNIHECLQSTRIKNHFSISFVACCFFRNQN
jgi:hypothetical protein